MEYYIRSSKYNIQERQTKKHGRVYDVVFRVVGKDDNIERQKKLSGYNTKAAAKAAYLDFVTESCELLKSAPVKPKIEVSDGSRKIADYFDEYIQSLGNQTKESTIYDRINVYRLFIENTIGDKKPQSLTKEIMTRWQDELWSAKNPRTGSYYSYAYLSKVRGQTSTFLSWIEERYNITNTLRSVRKPKKKRQKTEMQFWTLEEFQQFISSVDDPMYHCIFTLMFHTGQRENEILALTPEDFHADGTLRICRTISRKIVDRSEVKFKTAPTKADKDRVIPLCQTVKNEIASYNGQEPFYFGGEVPVHDNTLRRHFDRYIEKSGVKKIRLHDLRHSFASRLIHLGASLFAVAELIGDTVEQVQRTYGHLYESDKEHLIELLG